MKKKIRTYLLIFFSILIIISSISLVDWYLENKRAEKIVDKEEKNIIEKQDITLSKAILKDNPDTVAWLKIEGTNINYPVVQHKDNEYYLNHDFNKQKNSSGWIFMDYKNKFDDQNIVIYGHHRRNKSMFGSIDKLFDSNYTTFRKR